MSEFPATGSEEAQQEFILEQAWQYQTESGGSDDGGHNALGVDVDRECLDDFEQRLFERSKDAGMAGFYQWGLDVGPHQNRWDPYIGNSSEWAIGDMPDFDEEECQV